MTKGKYKRKGKNAQNEAEQGGLPIPLMNKERSQELKTNDTEHPGGDRRAQPTPTWYCSPKVPHGVFSLAIAPQKLLTGPISTSRTTSYEASSLNGL
jgi:hypothetical protein